MKASLLLLGAALALVPSALAAYPTPFAQRGGAGVDGYVASAAGPHATRLAHGAQAVTIRGVYGIPRLTQSGQMGGLSRDGRTLVLQNMGFAATSRFVVVRTSDLRTLDTIVLHGAFGFDALSPDASRLYLIQHRSLQDVQRYVVREYDLRTHRLLPGTIADKTQKGWTMRGWAIARATSADGRWAYTLYANPGGYPFVHALDTVRGVAHCVGLPWHEADQTPVWSFRLAVRGGSLAVLRRDGSTWKRVDRVTWRLS
jgi:hypothetical protein